MYARMDLEIEKLLKELTKKLGKDNFTLFLTADHAVVPIPQMLMDMRLPGGYHTSKLKMKELKLAILTKFNAPITLNEINQNIYLNRKEIDSLQLDFNAICDKFNIFKPALLGIVDNGWEIRMQGRFTTTNLQGNRTGA